MKQAVIRSTWMEGYGYRLDCSPYLGGALETKVLLEKLPLRKDPLHTLTAGFDGGIYNGPKFSRTWVESPDFGVRFVGSSAMLYADLSDLPLLSKTQAHGRQLRHLELQPGMSLISCSGTIGKMVYARPDMAGIWSSQHILKVVADPAKIPSGYLYAYLSSKFGIPLIVSGTYGSIIQSLGPGNIRGVPVPRLGDVLENEIHSLVEEAAALRVTATKQIRAARARLLKEFGAPPTPKTGTRHQNWAGHAIQSGRVLQTSRLDALYFNPVACELDEWVARHPSGSEALGDVANVFDVPPFKHIYVGPNEGLGFFTSADIFLIDKKPDKHLSRSQTKGLHKYILDAGWVLLARSGSLGGNIAKPQFADSAMAGTAASDHVIRIATKSASVSPGFLYAYLSLPELGYPLILRAATGACIPALWPMYLNHLRVLRPSRKLNEEVDVQIREAFEMRVRATKLEDDARSRLEAALERAGRE